MSAKTFLRAAFLKFARNGLFVLIFKNQKITADENHAELDMYLVLRDVIRDQLIPAEDESSEPSYLREEPIRDVFNQLFKFTNRNVVSTILFNLNKYVELVYSEPYDERLMGELGQFLTKLTKHTSEWKDIDWNANPVLNMISVVMKKNPIESKILIQPMRGFLKHAINKCSLTMESLVKLLSAYVAINEIVIFSETILEEVKIAFKGSRLRRNRDTLINLLQLLWWDMQPSDRSWNHIIERKVFGSTPFSDEKNPLLSIDQGGESARRSYFLNVAEYLFDDCINFLETPPVSKQYSKKEFKVGVCSTQLAVAICNQNYGLLARIFLWQKPMDSRRTIRLLNWTLLGILTADYSSGLITTVFDFQDNVVDLLSLTLKQPFNDMIGETNFLNSPAGELIYQSFVLIKIWTTLCSLIQKQQVKASHPSLQERDQLRQGQEKSKVTGAPRVHQKLSSTLSIAERKFWNFIWPGIKKPLFGTIVEKELQSSGMVYWEMFIDLITFLYLCGSDIVMTYSQEWFTLLDTLSKDELTMAAPPEFSQRVKQTLAMFSDPPLMMKKDMLITQLYLEMREAMRIYCEISNNATAAKLFGYI